MAFCVRSERKMEFQDNKPSVPGPGQYLKITLKNKLNEKRFFPPFHTSAQRNPFAKKNDYPGPGSYNLDSNNSNSLEQINVQQINKDNNNEEEENIFQEDIIITNYNTNEKINNNSLMSNLIGHNSTNSSKFNNISLKKETAKNRSLSLKNINFQNSKISSNFINTLSNINFDASFLNPYYQNEKLGFLSQATRFNPKKDIDNSNTPGPGSYLESINSTINDTKIKSKNDHKSLKAASLVENTGKLNRVVSIPSKIMNGYIYNEKKKTINSHGNDNENTSLYNNSIEGSSYSKNNIFNNTFQNNSNTNKVISNSKIDNSIHNNIPNRQLKLLINELSLKPDNNNSGTNELVGPGSYDAVLLEKNNSVVNWSKGFNLKNINKKNELKKKMRLIEEMKKNGEFNKYLYKKANKKIQKILNPYFNNEQIKLPKTNDLKNTINDSYRNSFIPDKSEIPGPGFYTKELINPKNDILKKDGKKEDDKENKEKIKKKIPDLSHGKYQCGNKKIIDSFGSHCERSINKSKSLEDLGPSTYFKQKNKYEPEKKNTIYKQLILGKTQMSCTVKNNFDFYFPEIPSDNSTDINNGINIIENQNKSFYKFKSKTNRFSKKNVYTLFNYNNIENKNTIDNNRKTFTKMSHTPFNKTVRSKSFYGFPGPGAYELSHTFIKPSFSSKQMMKSNVERFPDNDDGNPGPGSYQNVKKLEFGGNILLKKIIDKKYKHIRKDILKEKKIKKIIELNKKRNEVPGAGTYNIDKKNSITYKIYSKFNTNQSFQSPFLNSSGRFIQYKKDKNKISPALYEPYKYENVQKNKQYMVFNKANRFNKEIDEIRQKDWFLAGPGSYDLEPEWNKKSYNVLFSGNQ